jgi:hypothetical protein
VSPGARPLTPAGFHWLVVAGSAWFIGGAYLDGWAHHTRTLAETFFSPWHAVLYTGFGALAGLLVGTALANRRRGCAWAHAVPPGYLGSLLAIPAFFAFGVADLAWHTVFGIETDVAALLSPSHLGLDAAGAMIVAGPLRARLRELSRRHASRTLGARLPALLSLTFLLMLFNFAGQFVDPFGLTWMGLGYRPPEGATVVIPAALGGGLPADLVLQHVGVPPLLIHAALLAGCALFLAVWGELRPPSLTILMTVAGGAEIAMRSPFLSTSPLVLAAAALVGGLACDVAAFLLAPSRSRPRRLAALGACVPALALGAYVTAVVLGEGTWWPVHLWTGAVVVAGAIGVLLSLLIGGCDDHHAG